LVPATPGWDEDFFLVVSIDEPHHPYICAEPHVSMFEEFDLPMRRNCLDPLVHKPAHQRDWAEVSRERVEAARRDRAGACFVRQPRFLGCHHFCDTEVGDVLDAVGTALPDAVTLFTSDHGEMLGAHGSDGRGARSRSPRFGAEAHGRASMTACTRRR
jgi:uncharacterized sulfatase